MGEPNILPSENTPSINRFVDLNALSDKKSHSPLIPVLLALNYKLMLNTEKL